MPPPGSNPKYRWQKLTISAAFAPRYDQRVFHPAPGHRPDNGQGTRPLGRFQAAPSLGASPRLNGPSPEALASGASDRSEEHTSELQSRGDIVCSLLLEKKD